MTIYLVRHGQTEFNAAGRWHGQVDSPLTTLGLQQGERIGLALCELVDAADTAVFSSPLGRARDTAAIIAAAAGITEDIDFDPRLMEIGMGAWDGLSSYEIDMEWPNGRHGLDRFEWFFHSPDGERYAAFAERLARAMDDIAKNPAASKIVVSHGVAGRIIRGLFAGLDQTEALSLDVPQDAIFRLEQGHIDRIDCA